MTFLADMLAKFGVLHAAMFLLLYQWMPGISFAGTKNDWAGWKESQFALHNSNHGGSVEMDHHVVMSMQLETAERFAQPIVMMERPGTLFEVLDRDGLMDDLLWMEDMATSRPTPLQQAQVTEFLAWVE